MLSFIGHDCVSTGDKLRFARSKSLRENRKDPEGSKTDRNQNHGNPLHDVPEVKEKKRRKKKRKKKKIVLLCVASFESFYLFSKIA
jgi:hypothetical protein